MFAVQAEVCGNITGNVSDQISITFYSSEQPALKTMSKLDSIETVGTHTPDTNTEFITSIGLLATALMVCVVVFIIVISVILIRSKAKIEAALQQSASQGETINMEPMYEDITGSLSSSSAISTQDNVAYGHSQIATAR
jgi:flagellar biosynthesis/type III secretory pathway M-ring protein FliF/YscJ